jgi:hypothetical protein
MKKFECIVERVDKYAVEFDENIINEEWMKNFRKYMYDFFSLEEHAEHIAQFRARFGSKYIEGYGVPLENGKVPYWADEDDVNKAINIIVLSEDDEVEVDVF